MRWLIASKSYGRDIAVILDPIVNCGFILQDELVRGCMRFNVATQLLDYVGAQ